MAKRKRPHEEDVRDSPDYYRARVKIDQDEMDRCCAEQAELYSDISERLTNAVSARDQLIHDLDQRKAEVENKIRSKAAKSTDKITDKAVLAQIETHEDIVSMKEELLQAKAIVLHWQSVRADFEMREKMLKLLTQQFGDNYWSRESISASRRRYEGGEADRVRKETGKERRRERKPSRDEDDED